MARLTSKCSGRWRRRGHFDVRRRSESPRSARRQHPGPFIPNDPFFTKQAFYAQLGDIATIWNEYNGAGVHVGHYDSGVDFTNPDLAGHEDASRDVVINGQAQSGVPDDASTDATGQSHGTATAGLIAASGNNGTGVIGVAWGASLTSVNIFDSTAPDYINASDFTGFLSAVHQATNFDVTNNSWGESSYYGGDQNVNYPSFFAAQVVSQYGYVSANGRNGLGTVIVQSAGNDGLDANGDGVNASRYTVTVGALDPTGVRASYSNFGSSILVTAPGTTVTTDRSGPAGSNGGGAGDGFDGTGDYDGGFSGTSASAPLVTGIVALMLQANPNLGWRDIQNILALSASYVDPTNSQVATYGNWATNGAQNFNGGGDHISYLYGYGEANAYNAVRLAEASAYFAPTAQTSANEQTLSTGTLTPNLTIAANATTTYTFNLAGSLDLEHVDLTLGIDTNDFPNLAVTLTSPDGTQQVVYDGPGEYLSQYDAYVYPAQASPNLWTYGLDGLRGELAAGTWTLTLQDQGGNGGTLNTVDLTAFGSTPTTDQVYHYTDEFHTMAAQDPTRTALDAAGTGDWIDASTLHSASTIDLGAGTATIDDTGLTISGDVTNAIGGDGNDVLTAAAAGGELVGMRGDDTLVAGPGADTLVGGPGADTFVESAPPSSAADTIKDFDQGDAGTYHAGEGDTLDLTRLLASAYEGGQSVYNLVRLVAVQGGALLEIDPSALTGGWVTLATLNGLGLGQSAIAILDGIGSSLLLSAEDTNAAIAIVGTAQPAIQGGAPVTLLAAAPLITDASGTGTLAGASVTITENGTPQAGDVLSVAGTTFTSSTTSYTDSATGVTYQIAFDASTGTLSIASTNTTTTDADYARLLAQVQYQDLSTEPTTGFNPSRTVTFQITEPDGSTATAPTIATEMLTIDRAPTRLSDAGARTTFDQPSISGSVAGTTADPDGDALMVASLANGPLQGVAGLPFAGTYGTLTLGTDGTYSYRPDVAAIETAPLGSALDTFAFTTADRYGAVSPSTTLAVHVDAPITLGFAGNAVAYTANAAPIAIDPNLTITDPNGSMLSGATVTISAPGNSTFHFTNQNNIVGTFSRSLGILTLLGTDTVADYQAALQSVTYSNITFNPLTTYVVTWQVTDSQGVTGTATTSLLQASIAAAGNNPAVPLAFDIASEADLNAAIDAVDARFSVGTGARYLFNFTADLTGANALTSDVHGLQVSGLSTVAIEGNGHTIDGASTYRGFTLLSGKTTIQDLTLQNLAAPGSAGGALSVNASASTVLDGVTFAGNTASAGGAVDVQSGGQLTYGQGGQSGDSATTGASPAGIFLEGNQTLTLTPLANQTLTLGDPIGGETGAKGTGVAQLSVAGAGTVILGAANTYGGGTTLEGGTLELAAAGAAGTGAITFGTQNGGTLRLDAAAFASDGTFASSVTNFGFGAILDLRGLSYVAGASATLVGGALAATSDGVTETLTSFAPAAGVNLAQDGFRTLSDGAGGTFVTLDPHLATSSAPLLAAASDSGAAGDGITNVRTPTFSGTARPSETVSLYDDGRTLLGTASADASTGYWAIMSNKLGLGRHTIQALVQDSSGNASALSAATSTDIVASVASPFTLTTGADTVAFAGPGPNTVNGTAATVNASDRLFGNGGDRLSLTGGGSVNLGALAHFGGFGQIRLDNQTYNLTLGDANVASGKILTISAAALTGSHTLTFKGAAETNGAFRITAGAGNDHLTTGAGADTINGGTGADIMTGGAGNDIYYVDNAADRVIEATGGGTDRVLTSVSYRLAAGQEIETLQTTSAATTTNLNLTGNAIANTLRGNAGANRLDGGGGADKMYGYAGNDYYYVDNAGDRVFETAGNGNDRVVTSVNYTLASGQSIETLQTTGTTTTTNLALTGNELANTLLGNAGDNRLNGGGGADKMYGYGGDDTYYVDNAADRVFETAGNGNDRVLTTVSYALAAGQEIETLQTTGAATTTNLNLIGNEIANTIYGNAGDNVIDGGAGNDRLRGYGGNDTFVFDTTPNTTANDDTIVDFTVGQDMIDLSHAIYGALPTGALASSAFTTGSAATTSAQHVIYNAGTGALFYDADGNGSGSAVQFAKLSKGLALTAAQFQITA